MSNMIGENLSKLRREQGLTQEDLAARLEVPGITVVQWEEGESLPDTESLVAIAKVLKTSVDSLLDLEKVDKSSASNISNQNIEADFRKWRAERRGETSHDDDSETVDVSKDDYTFKVGGTNVKISHAAFPYPIIITGVYLLAGFLFNWWHPGWLLFLTIPLYYTMPDFEKMTKRRALLQFPYPIMVLLVYLVMGCLFNWWHPWWILFLTIPIYYILAANVDKA